MSWKEDFKREKALYEAKEQEKRALKEAKKAEKMKDKPVLNEQEKLAKNANFIIKGFAFWYLLPTFAVIIIIGVFVAFWIWDMTIGKLF